MNSDDIAAIVRHVLTSAGGALVASGSLTSDQLTSAAGAIALLAGLGWSLYQKRAQRKAVAVALATPVPAATPGAPNV